MMLPKSMIDEYSYIEQIALIQLMRLDNSLRSWMTNLEALVRAKRVYTCDALEIYYVICANFYEACKTFFKDIYPKLKDKEFNNKVREDINAWEVEWNNYRINKNNKIL